MSDEAFAASLAAAAAMEPTAAAVPNARSVGVDGGEVDNNPPVDDAEAGSDDADDSADAGDDDGQEVDGEDSGEVSDAVADAKAKFLAGDKNAALKALGLDPKILDLNDAKFRTMRQGLKEADTKLAAATAKETAALAAEEKAARLYEQGKKELGPVLQMKRLLSKGDYASAKDLLEACAPPGTTYRQIAEGIAAAASGMSAAEQLYRRKLRELDAAEHEKEPEPEKKAPAVDAGKNLEGAKKMLASTPLDGVPGAAEALVRIASENWDAEKKGFKVPRAQLVELVKKDPVISQLLELKALKAKGKKAPEPEVEAEELPVKRDPKGRFRERPRVESKLTPEQQRAAKQEADFKASIAEAAAMERQQSRVSGKGRR